MTNQPERINIIPNSITDLSYRDCQKLCKYYGLPANLKHSELIDQLLTIANEVSLRRSAVHEFAERSAEYEKELFSNTKQKGEVT